MASGVFTISLDFELDWGTRDHRSIDSYRTNLLGVRAAVPAMLDLFAKHAVHATWATVGFLFFRTRDELLAGLPPARPAYKNQALDPYRGLSSSLGPSEEADPFHYAPSLIELIASRPGQEIGSHTLSHYYCLEEGQTPEAFRADLQAASDAAAKAGMTLRSLVFPRNQYNAQYVSTCREVGISSYRGNPDSWVYEPRNGEQESLLRRDVRLLDSYVNLTGHHGHALGRARQTPPYDIPASRFLRPYSRKLRLLDPLRKKRICDDLTHAAENDLVYHLWWHPHNFGADTAENVAFLDDVLHHYSKLRRSHGMRSLNMGEIADELAS